jgi:deoxycytidylate deaminase
MKKQRLAYEGIEPCERCKALPVKFRCKTICVLHHDERNEFFRRLVEAQNEVR